MASMNMQGPMPATYDPRWFIWTIVFLVVTGISLVSYITLSDTGTEDSAIVSPARASVAPHKTIKK